MRTICQTLLVALALVAGLFAANAEAQTNDRHAGYYYPKPQSIEFYEPRAKILPDSNKRRRIGFTVQLAEQTLKRPYAPELAIFAKGADAEKLIIVSMREGYADTLFRARALLAQLTAVSRGTPLMQNLGVADSFTFFDLLVLMGFEQMTISDGHEFAHQVKFEAPQ